MNLRTKLSVSHAVTALVVTVVVVAILLILRVGELNRRELGASYEQIRAINVIATRANDYSEQVAELFILGVDMAEVEMARTGLLDALAAKERLVEDEIADLLETFPRNEREIGRERLEIERARSIRTTFEELDRVTVRLGSLLAEGRREEAEAIYRNQVENRFDSVLGAMIDEATVNEREEITATIAASETLGQRLQLLALLLVGVVVLLALANAIMIHRSITRPITLLAAGANAIGSGDLSHRVKVVRDDELGALADRFNSMTAKICDQRDRLLVAKVDLENQVAERTEELRARGNDLEQAVVRLRELDENRVRFFADISHELRTPLTILRGHAEVTLRSPDNSPDRLRNALSQVVRKSYDMGRLVEDLLFLARSEAGTIAVERKTVDLQEVFADVLLDSQSLSRCNGITISPRQPSDPLIVMGDADRLRQAIMIPLDNSIRLAPADSTVHLALAARDGRATISISDDGPGFTVEEARRAFVRFSRAGAGRGRTGRGTGLGLSIARWIVDRHGGEISIDSEHGRGATVLIDLPLAETV